MAHSGYCSVAAVESTLSQLGVTCVVKSAFLQHTTMLTTDSSNVGEHVARRQKLWWVEESGACGGE